MTRYKYTSVVLEAEKRFLRRPNTTIENTEVIESDSESGNDTLDSILDHKKFYQTLNNSSQYLRRDSFAR